MSDLTDIELEQSAVTEPGMDAYLGGPLEEEIRNYYLSQNQVRKDLHLPSAEQPKSEDQSYAQREPSCTTPHEDPSSPGYNPQK